MLKDMYYMCMFEAVHMSEAEYTTFFKYIFFWVVDEYRYM